MADVNVVTSTNLGSDFDIGTVQANKINIKRAAAGVYGLVRLEDLVAPSGVFTLTSGSTISGTSINSSPIGATTPATGNFTTLTASSTARLGGASTFSTETLTVLKTASGSIATAEVLQNSGTTSGSGVGLDFVTNTNSTAAVSLAAVSAVSTSTTGTGDLVFSSSNAGSLTEKLRLTGDGRFLIGGTAGRAFFGVERSLQIESANGVTAAISITRNSNDTVGPKVILAKTRDVALGGFTAPAVNDEVGSIQWVGSDGAQFTQLALIGAYVDSTVAGNSTPGRITFQTVPLAGSSLVERARLDSNGNFGVGTTSPAARIHALGSIRQQSSVDVTDGINQYNAAGTLAGSLVSSGTTYFRLQAEAGISQLSLNSVAGPVTFSFNGTETARFTTAGWLGIGTSAPARPMHVVSSDTRVALRLHSTLTTGTDALTGIDFSNYDGAAVTTGGTISYSYGLQSTNPNSMLFSNTRAGTIRFATNNTEQMRIDSTGNVAIGATAASGKLTVQTSAGKFDVTADGASSVKILSFNGDLKYSAASSSVHAWDIAGTERARLSASSFLVGATAAIGTERALFAQGLAGSAATPIVAQNTGTTTGTGSGISLVTNTSSTAPVSLASLTATSTNTTGTGYASLLVSAAGTPIERLRVTGTDLIVGNGDSNASPLTGIVRGTDGSGTDIPGAGVTIVTGRGTGLGAGGSFIVQTTPAGGSTGSTLNATPFTRLTINSNGQSTFTNNTDNAASNILTVQNTGTSVGTAAQIRLMSNTNGGSGAEIAAFRGIPTDTSGGGSLAVFVGVAGTATSRVLLTTTELVLGGLSTSTAPVAMTVRGPTGSGTNIAGADLTLQPSASTGSGNSGELVVKTAPTGSSGATANTALERLRVTRTGDLVITGVGALGYATGSGGTVTQATSKATAVTLNKTNGQITMNAASLAANTGVSFTLTNSTIGTNDVVYTQIKSGATAAAYSIQCDSSTAGSCQISLRNLTAGALAEAVVVSFVVVRAATA